MVGQFVRSAISTWMMLWEPLTVVPENIIKEYGGEVTEKQILKHIKYELSLFF